MCEGMAQARAPLPNWDYFLQVNTDAIWGTRLEKAFFNLSPLVLLACVVKQLTVAVCSDAIHISTIY